MHLRRRLFSDPRALACVIGIALLVAASRYLHARTAAVLPAQAARAPGAAAGRTAARVAGIDRAWRVAAASWELEPEAASCAAGEAVEHAPDAHEPALAAALAGLDVAVGR